MNLANSLEEREPAAAATWMKIALVGTIDQQVLYAPSGYPLVASYWHRMEAMAAVKANDAARAEASFQRCLDYFPMHIDLAEEQLVATREAGLPEVADKI